MMPQVNPATPASNLLGFDRTALGGSGPLAAEI